MKKGWRIILGIVLGAILVGAVCFGVGLLTGADMARIMQNLNDHYHLSAYLNAYMDYAARLFQNLKNLF